jgi:integrase
MGGRRRRFGWIRKLPSGNYQASYPGPDGLRRYAPNTFKRKADAERYLNTVEALLLRNDWTDPERAKVRLGDYAGVWIAERPGLRPRTVELYRWLLAKYIEPRLGGVELGKLSTPVIREWRSRLLGDGVSNTMTAKTYRLIRAILNTAVNEDKILASNPCRIRGADQEQADELPVLTVAQVFDLARRMKHERFRVLILVTAFCSLRWGEATALRRCDIAEDASSIHVRVAHTEVKGKGIVVGPPKSRAGVRTITVPTAIRRELKEHLEKYAKAAPDSLVFTGPKGAALRRGNFNQMVKWTATVAKLGVAGLHFHDLRHTGNHFAARSGASTKELMARMGHDDMRAALIYQRATSEADREIADRMSGMVTEYREGKAERSTDEDDGEADGPGDMAPAS